MSGYEFPAMGAASAPEIGQQFSPAELQARMTAPVARLALAVYEPDGVGGWDKIAAQPPTYTY